MRIIERDPVRLVTAVLKALRQEVEKRYQLGALEAGQHVDELTCGRRTLNTSMRSVTRPCSGREGEEH